MGREFSVEGMVTEGKRLGGKIGFPTVNFASEKGRTTSAECRLCVLCNLRRRKKYLAMTNVGDNPTVDKKILTSAPKRIFF
ncbi:MAG: riboflavin kinase [Clostridiales bacterium]|nr:MAG: riboflavin kinase [Clostridiales bacterium]